MAARYELHLLDPNNLVGGLPGLVAVLDDWRDLSYTMRINDRGDHRLELGGDPKPRPDGLDIIGLFTSTPDLMIEVWREDPTAGIAKYVDGEFFHRTSQRSETAGGQELFTSFGRGYTDLLSRRIIGYDLGDAGSDKIGPTEDVIKEYVDENLGPNATSPTRLADGVAQNFSVMASGGNGDIWEGARAYRNLLDVCQEVAAFDSTGSGLGFDFLVVGKYVVNQGAPGDWLEFQTGNPWGLDRTQGNGVNPPAVFSTGLGNMLLPVYSESHIEEKSRVFALGQGSGGGRIVHIVDYAGRQAESPWNLAEMVKNANLESTTSGLAALAEAAGRETDTRKTFSFQVLQTIGSRYGRDYFLGDLITAQYRGASLTRKIVGVSVRVSREGSAGGSQVEDIRLELADVSPFGAGGDGAASRR